MNAAHGRRFRFFFYRKPEGQITCTTKKKDKSNDLHTPETHGSQNTGNITLMYALAFHKQLLYATNSLRTVSFSLSFCPRRRSPPYKKSQRKPEKPEKHSPREYKYRSFCIQVLHGIYATRPRPIKSALQKEKRSMDDGKRTGNGRETRNI